MNVYEVIGVGKKTRRKRKRQYVCWSEEEAAAKAKADGTEVESVYFVSKEHATEAQRNYADNVGLKYPSDISMTEMSELLTCYEDRDRPATDRHRAFAEHYRVRHSPFIGKKLLFDRIFAEVTEKGRERDLLMWFAFRVYRDLCGGKQGMTIDHPGHRAFEAVAEAFAHDEQVIKSIRRYGEGRALIWFGEWTAPDGGWYHGASKSTIAWKRIAPEVARQTGLMLRTGTAITRKTRTFSSPQGRGKTPHTNKSGGCLVAVALLALATVALATMFMSFTGRGFVVRDLPWTEERLRKLPPFEFENWAVIALGGVPNKVQVGDMGVDGRIFPAGTKPSSAEGMFAGDWFPVQVKQVDKVGRPDVDQFEAVMARENRDRGFFVAFGYTADAEREAARFHRQTGRLIKLLTVREILDEEHVQKM